MSDAAGCGGTPPAMPGRTARVPVAAAAVALLGLGASSCSAASPIPPVAPEVSALNSASDHAGLAATMPPTAGPSPTPAVVPTAVVEPPEPLTTPPGFGVGVFADELGPVRFLAVSPAGDVVASVPELDRILVLPDRDANGVADEVRVFAEGEPLNRPSGLAFHDGWLYVANTDGVIRFPLQPDRLIPAAPPESVLVLPGGGLHADHALAFGVDDALYVSVGSSCNVCVEEDVRRAAILRIEPDGTKVTRYASGVRNALGLEIAPGTGAVWFTDSERDHLAEDQPPDELNVLLPGGDYGWPRCYGQRQPDPEHGGTDRECTGTIPPAVEFLAHAGAHGMAFYDGAAFPEEYRGGLFVALHGSWSRAIPVGFSLLYVPFSGGAPTGEVRPVVQGWLRPDTRRWGSPVDVVVADDGALLVSDDGGGRVYRVFFDGPLGTPTPRFSR